MSSNLKKDLFTGTFWSLIGQFGYLGVALIANIMLARILSPAEFGQLGIVLFFIVTARVLTESGLGGALVRNKNATDIDYSTIFIFNLAVSVILCIILIISSGYIASFYEDESLKKLLITSSFIFIINAFQFVQSAKLVKQMRFKQKAIYEFIAILIAAIVGILLAVNDFGVWSLVIMQLLTALILTVLIWMIEGGHGALVFNKSSFKFHYKFGVNTTLASILNTIFDNIYQVILGKYFAITQTGFYYQAKKLQELPVGVINKLTQSVLFSGLSRIQEEKTKFKDIYHRVIRLFTVVVGFICLVLFVFAHELILLLLGDQWVEGTFFLQILSVVAFFDIQEKFNRILFKVFNDTKYILRLEFIKKAIQSVSIIIGLVLKSTDYLLIGLLVTSIISYFINVYVTGKIYLFIGSKEIRVVLITFLLAFIIGFVNSLFSDMMIFYRIPLIFALYSSGLFILRLLSLDDINKLKTLL